MPAPSPIDKNLPDLVLVNPKAGGGRAACELVVLQNFAQRESWNVDFISTSSAEELASRSYAEASRGRARIFVLGGDGTLQVVVNAIGLRSNVVLGVLPAGGGNDLAASLGLSRDAVTAAKQLLQGVPCPLDAVQVRTSEGFERYYVGGGGLGLDAEASRYARSAYCNVGGRRRYVLSAIRALIHFHSVQVRVEFENGDAAILCESALLLGILNTPSYGAGVRLAPEARTDDGELDLVLLEKLGFFEVLAMLPALIMTGTVRAKRLQRKKVKCVRIETDRPCNFHGDGEILGTTPVEIEVVPRAVLVLRPRPAVGSV